MDKMEPPSMYCTSQLDIATAVVPNVTRFFFTGDFSHLAIYMGSEGSMNTLYQTILPIYACGLQNTVFMKYTVTSRCKVK